MLDYFLTITDVFMTVGGPQFGFKYLDGYYKDGTNLFDCKDMQLGLAWLEMVGLSLESAADRLPTEVAKGVPFREQQSKRLGEALFVLPNRYLIESPLRCCYNASPSIRKGTASWVRFK